MPPEDSGNHICCLIDVRGPLTERDCGAAIQRAVDRQDVLRLSILPGKERPLQMIRSSSEANFEYRELAPDQARPEAIEELATEIFRKPFDLMQGPLYRVVDLCAPPNQHLLVFAVHHAIADGWSLGVFVQDLIGAYLEIIMRSSKPLPPVPQKYVEWGAAERARWQPETLEKRVDFWKTNLKGSPRMWNVPIPPGTPQPPGRSFAEDRAWVRENGWRYPGCWIITIGSRFILADPSWQSAQQRVRELVDLENELPFGSYQAPAPVEDAE